MLLKGRLRDAERVDARVDDLERVLSGARAEVRLRAVGHIPCDGVAARARSPDARVEVVDLARQLVAHLRNLRGVVGDEDDAVVVAVDLGSHLLHVVALGFGRGLHADGRSLGQALQVVLHLHLHDEVRAASQVEAEVDVVAENVVNAREREVPGIGRAARPKDCRQRKERHDGDDDDAL